MFTTCVEGVSECSADDSQARLEITCGGLKAWKKGEHGLTTAVHKHLAPGISPTRILQYITHNLHHWV